MTAPKIDTQAPDTIWAFIDADLGGPRYEFSTSHADDADVESLRRDLADARAAAAWIEGRDVALNEFDRVLYWPRKEGAQTKHFRQVLTPPTDLAAALDRLIAEARREARNSVWDEAADIMDGYGQHGYAEEFRARICAARGSKEGRDV